LHHNSTLLHHDSFFFGEIFNGGFISVHRVLSIVGNYTQWGHGSLLSHLDLSARSSGYLNITGYALLNGTLQYAIDVARNSTSKMQLPVVQTTEGVLGKFIEEVVNIGELVDHTSKIGYSNNDVYMTFGYDSESPVSLWWVWFIVVIGAIAVVGLIVLLVRTMRRKDYTPLNN